MRGYSDIWAMIAQLPGEGLEPEELKEVLVQGVSGGRTTSLRELTGGELAKLRQELRERTNSKPERASGELRRKRSLALKQLEIYGINTKVWSAVNAFVSDSRIAGKEFAELDEEELDQLRKKMYAINRKSRKAKNKEVEKRMSVVAPIKRSKIKRVNYVSSVSINDLVTNYKYN